MTDDEEKKAGLTLKVSLCDDLTANVDDVYGNMT
jgi:hypothetical protein